MADSNGGVMTSPLSKQQRMYNIYYNEDKFFLNICFKALIIESQNYKL